MAVQKQLVFVVDLKQRRAGLLRSATYDTAACPWLLARSALFEALQAKIAKSAPEHRAAISARAVDDIKEARAAMSIEDPAQRAAALRMALAPIPADEPT
jgi:hypothetical protein